MNTADRARRVLENVQRCRKQLARAERELSKMAIEIMQDRDVRLEIEEDVVKLAARRIDHGD